jgi:hypothetical protein
MRHLRVHSLRHFYASAQIALGTDIKYIDERRVAATRLEAMLSG